MVEQRTGSPGLPAAFLGWWVSVLEEFARAPNTVAQLRRLLHGIAELPSQLERVVDSVEATTAPLTGTLEDVAGALAEIRDRLDHLDSVIGHLRDTLVAVIAAVPGAGRVLDRLPPPPPPSAARGGELSAALPSAPASPGPGPGEGR